MKYGKRLKEAYASVEKGKLYSIDEALEILKANAKAKFNESVDIAVQLGVDPKQSDQMVRGAVSLPAGIGKTLRVAVFAKGPKADEALKAGADMIVDETVEQDIANGKLNFDRLIATPDMMGVVGKYGKILGPRGLMPNPKLGTVTLEITEAVKAAKAGKVQFKVDPTGIVHAGIGKVSFENKDLKENAIAFVKALVAVKPASSKGLYLKKVSLSTTQGIGVKVIPVSVGA